MKPHETQRLPVDWTPTVAANGRKLPVVDVGQLYLPMPSVDVDPRATTQPIRFCASEAAEIWIEAMHGGRP